MLGWVAVSPTSDRDVYRGVVEDALYVTEGARGRGVGRALLEQLVASTDAGDVWTICSGIFPENVTSLALHESLGFRSLGVRERIGLMTYGPMAGKWRDVVWMERRRPGLTRVASPPRQSGLPGTHDRLRTVLDVQLGEDVRHMVSHRLVRQHQTAGDVGVGQSERDQRQDLLLPVREHRKRAGSSRPPVGREQAEHPAGDISTEDGLADATARTASRIRRPSAPFTR